MDNTTLTILGMIAAFITASITSFLGEPIKSYFENKNKLNNLRIALYKELIINYHQLNIPNEEDGKLLIDLIMQNGIRTECYRYAVENNLTLFYQLSESIVISELYNTFSLLNQDANNVYKEINKEFSFTANSNGFLNSLALFIAMGVIDKKLIKKLAPQTVYFDILKKGKNELSKKNAKEKSQSLTN